MWHFTCIEIRALYDTFYWNPNEGTLRGVSPWFCAGWPALYLPSLHVWPSKAAFQLTGSWAPFLACVDSWGCWPADRLPYLPVWLPEATGQLTGSLFYLYGLLGLLASWPAPFSTSVASCGCWPANQLPFLPVWPHEVTVKQTGATFVRHPATFYRIEYYTLCDH